MLDVNEVAKSLDLRGIFNEQATKRFDDSVIGAKGGQIGIRNSYKYTLIL